MNTNIGGVMTGQFIPKGEITVSIPIGKITGPIKKVFNTIKLFYKKTFLFDMQNLFSAPVE